MAKPILFTTITRAAYEALSDKDKTKTNYQIKETDGTITKVIPGLEGGESGLPAVTSDDNGSVLTVVEGAWDKADAPSGNNDFVVTYTDNEGTITATDEDGNPITFAEITAAFEAGKNVRAVDGSGVIFSISTYEANNFVWFSACTIESGKIFVYQITHDSSDSIVVTGEAVTPDAD